MLSCYRNPSVSQWLPPRALSSTVFRPLGTSHKPSVPSRLPVRVDGSGLTQQAPLSRDLARLRYRAIPRNAESRRASRIADAGGQVDGDNSALLKHHGLD